MPEGKPVESLEIKKQINSIAKEIIEEAIMQGYLEKDGIHIAKRSSLPKLAEFLIKKIENLTIHHFEGFRQKNDKPYEESTIEDAIKKVTIRPKKQNRNRNVMNS